MFFFFFENCTVCEKMWKNSVEPGRTQMTILRERIISCVPQATDTLSEYVKFNTFPFQQRLRESAPVLHLPPLPALLSTILHPCTCH
jgi:hypothetical protein